MFKYVALKHIQDRAPKEREEENLYCGGNDNRQQRSVKY
jgi:hypothetical protein